MTGRGKDRETLPNAEIRHAFQRLPLATSMPVVTADALAKIKRRRSREARRLTIRTS